MKTWTKELSQAIICSCSISQDKCYVIFCLSSPSSNSTPHTPQKHCKTDGNTCATYSRALTQQLCTNKKNSEPCCPLTLALFKQIYSSTKAKKFDEASDITSGAVQPRKKICMCGCAHDVHLGMQYVHLIVCVARIWASMGVQSSTEKVWRQKPDPWFQCHFTLCNHMGSPGHIAASAQQKIDLPNSVLITP